jgi:hypothetical protein
VTAVDVDITDSAGIPAAVDEDIRTRWRIDAQINSVGWVRIGGVGATSNRKLREHRPCSLRSTRTRPRCASRWATRPPTRSQPTLGKGCTEPSMWDPVTCGLIRRSGAYFTGGVE